MEINPNEVYTAEEAQDFLKISNSTIKRLIKGGILKAHKVGGRYRILGKDVLRAVSPEVESRTANIYLRLKKKVKQMIQDW